MAWARLDDAFYRHPKVEALLREEKGGEALGLHLLVLSFCAEHLTDGLFYDHQFRSVVPWARNRARARASDLARHRLWDTLGDGLGWRIHDFLQYNPSRDKVLANREQWRQRQDRHRELSRRDTTSDARNVSRRESQRSRSRSPFETSFQGVTHVDNPVDNSATSVDKLATGPSPDCVVCGGTGWTDTEPVLRCTACQALRVVPIGRP